MGSTLRLALCFLAFHLSIVLGADEFSVIKGLQFSESESNLRLDLFLPENNANNHPCVIVIQGGGFKPQDGQRFKAFARHLAENQLAAALIAYRGRPNHHYAETIKDIEDSVRYIRSVADKYQIDPNRIGATGRSAGGTLAALLAVSPSDELSQIQAAVCFAGVFDFVSRFSAKEQLALQPQHQTKIESNGEWIGAPFSAADEHWLAASAINHVDKDDPPILFLHSRNDSTVPWIQSRDMHKAMLKAGISSEITIYPDGGHSVNPRDHDSKLAMTKFFHKHLLPGQ